MNENQHQGPLANEVSDWLDDDSSPSELASKPLPPEDERLVADMQVTDALLTSLSPQAQQEQSQRLDLALEAIRREGTDEKQIAHAPLSTSRLTAWATAACFALAVSVFWLNSVRESRAVEGVLREMIAASLQSIERVYAVERGGRNQREPIGKLYLRGCDGFVLETNDAVLGRTGDEYWLVEPKGDVIVAEDFGWLAGASERQRREAVLLREIAVASQRSPLVELSATMELLKHDYKVRLQDQQEIDGQPVYTVVGERRGGDSLLPARIVLHAEQRTHVVCQVEFWWDGASQDCVSLRLLDVPPQTDDWYRHQHHHPPDRPIRRISTER